MSDYNADPDPDLNKINQIAFGFALFALDTVKTDQFSTSGTDKVYHVVRKIGSHRMQYLVDPDEIPTT